ncbi:MAG: hypothetical protein M3Y22_08500 [Pseudomonadota bacterium]|nr:hypothetical protein [Pseudomonadota bacterium]
MGGDMASPYLLGQTTFRRVSWGAIAAGMVIAIVVQLVLSLLGAGIGLSTIDPLRYNTPDASTFGIGAGIWLVISSVLALYAGGWVAGHLSGSPDKTDAVLHGVLTWGLATIVTFYLLASLVSSVVRGGASVVGKTASAAAAGVGAAAGPAADMAKDQLASSGITLDSMKSQVQKLLAQTGNPALQPGAIASQASAAAGQLTTAAAGASGNAPAEDIQGILQKIMTAGKDTVDQADRESVINVVIARTGVSRAEAEQRTDAWIKQYQNARAELVQAKVQAEAKARQVADDAASASSKAALGAVLALVLGAAAAALGGMTACRRVDVVTERHTGEYVATLPR